MLTPVIFRHDFYPGFATVCTSEDWAAVAALVAAVYKIDSSAYTNQLADLAGQVAERSQDIAPRGTGIVYLPEIVDTKSGQAVEITIQRADQTTIKALNIWLHCLGK